MEVTSLKIDNLDLKSGDFIFYPRNLFNLDNTIIDNDLYGNGKTFNRSKVNPRKFIINGFIQDNVQSNLALLSGIFNDGKVHRLTVGILGMPTRYIDIVKQNEVVAEPFNDEISYQVSAEDPYIYELTPHVITLGATSNSGLTFPFTFPIVFGASTGGQGIVTNIGNAVAYPVIAIVGTCDTFTITNQTTGENMSLAVSLASDYDTLIIDSREASRSILINGINRIDLKVGDWLSCVPGDNTFVFTRNSLQVKQHLTIQLQGRWL